MASTEQPLKKRRVYEPPPPSSPPPDPPPPPLTPPPLSQEEITRGRRIKEEIRKVFDCYKKIKSCIDQKDKRFMPELEEAYLDLITSSRGAVGVQRLVAVYIPRYASYCPTALEAAVKVVVDMHNCSSMSISQGEDDDGISFEIAKACTLGLIDLCHVASSEASASGVKQGICSALFLNVVTFFMSSFGGKDIFQIVDQKIMKIYEAAESFSEVKDEFLAEDNSVLLKLSKICALSFLRIVLCWPKNLLGTCFELLGTTGTEGPQIGKNLLNQLTSKLKDVGPHHSNEDCDDQSSNDRTRTKCYGKHLDGSSALSRNTLSSSTQPILKNCLLGLILGKDPSVKSLIFSSYKTLCDSAPPQLVSEVTSILEEVFESFTRQVKAENSRTDGHKYVSQHSFCRISSQQGSPSVVSGRDFADKMSGIQLNTTISAGIDPIGSGESTPMDFHYGDPAEFSNVRPFMPKELFNRPPFSPRETFSPRERPPREFRSNSFNDRNPSLGSPFESPKQNIHSPRSPACYSDGDPAALDIFPASKQLWLGPIGPDIPERLITSQFEKFGYIDHFHYSPFNGFATIEYRKIMDAVKAREVMRGRSLGGACLRIKFLDAGLGTRGVIHGTAVGSSCSIYIGNVTSKWAMDEMVKEVKKMIQKPPRMVLELNNEKALLMEFDSPEDATASIVQLRWWRRKESSNFIPPSNLGVSPSLHVDTRHNSMIYEKHSDYHSPTLPVRPNNGVFELTSPRIIQENHGRMAFQSNWTSGPTERPWMYGKPEHGMPTNFGPQHPYGPPNSAWDARGLGHHPPPHHPGVIGNNSHANLQGPPFLPASVTPLSQIHGRPIAPFDQRFSAPIISSPSASIQPPHPSNVHPPLPYPEFRPPLPPQHEFPPPLPEAPPPPLPPPPHSQPPQYSWQGILSKSGVQYSTMNAQRVDSDICNYKDISEPAEWPAKLDMTKRTDLRHVKSTFSNTPPSRREVCWLLPSSHDDHKGFQDFISYLKQRDCAGVIKIPAVKSMWARLLFLLPYSPETCSMLAIPPNPSLCLIGLILPKETNSEGL